MTAPEDRTDSDSIRERLQEVIADSGAHWHDRTWRERYEAREDEAHLLGLLVSAVERERAAAEARLEAVKALLDCGQVVEPGCCTACKGTGYSGEESTGGKCCDCRSTGHPHAPVETDDLQQFLAAVRRAALSVAPQPQPAAECEEESAYWFMARHDQHDVGSRHEDGSLLSATCHDCGETYRRASGPS